jgi:uncharacterized RDD family membrane protein YckC
MIEKEMTAGSRIAAMLLDHIVMTIVIMILAWPIMAIGFKDSFGDKTNSMPTAINWTLYVLLFGVSLYFNKDMIQGKSVAKRALKQEVVDIKTGEVASSLKCLVRNLTIIIWPIEVIAVLISPSKRIGDFIAGTRVEYITTERNSKPKIDFKNLILSIIMSFMIVFAGSFLVKNKIGDGSFDNPDYIGTSYNKALSSQLENHLDSICSDYLIYTNIKVYDSISNDSRKYVSASFYLKENYIDKSSFESIKQKIFSSMYQIIPKSDFILMGQFVYEGKTIQNSTSRIYDWRKIDK